MLLTEEGAQLPLCIKEEKDDPECYNKVTNSADVQPEQPPPKRLASSASPPSTILSPLPSYHVHDICRSSKDHVIKESERPSMQLPWNPTFRDRDDFDYTVKLLQKSLGESAIKRRQPPRPVEVLSKVFPSHKENILELVLKGCSGDIVLAIECILAGKNNSTDTPVSSSHTVASVHALGQSSYQSVQFTGIKPTLLTTLPPALSLTPYPRITKTTTHPMTTAGILPGHKYGGSRFSPYLRNLSVQTHAGGKEDAEMARYSDSNGLLKAQFLPSVSASPHSPDDSSSTRSEISVCFHCDTKPRPGDRFCSKCGMDLKC